MYSHRHFYGDKCVPVNDDAYPVFLDVIEETPDGWIRAKTRNYIVHAQVSQRPSMHNFKNSHIQRMHIDQATTGKTIFFIDYDGTVTGIIPQDTLQAIINTLECHRIFVSPLED